MALLDIKDLRVDIDTPAGVLHAVRGVDLSVEPGETLCIVGESGCGKSMTAMAVLGLLPATAKRRADYLRFEGKDIDALSPRALEDLRGARIGMIFQDPMTGLNPTLTIGRQLTETYLRHVSRSAAAARERAIALLGEVGIRDAAARLSQYPHELSGGLRQRVMIAMALIAEPQLIIADEPTTALDVTVQAQVLAVLRRLQTRYGVGLILITHDLGVVAAIADRVNVMYAGEVVETGTVREVLLSPSHPYTRALLSCVPDPRKRARSALGSIPGRVPTLIGSMRGCAFAGRCAEELPHCATTEIPAHPEGSSEICRCLRPTMDIPERAHV
ncbi:peptide ABC transporter substrate-binding protein (plasmid) [Salipiger sp. CCB-MM3]|uniref:ABC transporter ATP-binding protein n=1 Tax=Salipiger sp. CCB-MM3 TaxID=1792508 RepID=UPI00080ABD9D|nr:ABC transporter ATP-binding protein [Salipiger sp. CCB-MM3]ANT63717.1 peptide ABC transporter substrate-binding protein [Salipiger sp. CCB-MM3]